MQPLSLCLVAVLVACATRVAAPPASPKGTIALLEEISPRVFPGETMTWKLTVLGLEIGRARMAVGEPTKFRNKTVLALAAEGKSSGLSLIFKSMTDRYYAWMAVDSGVPLWTRSDFDTNGKRKHIVATRNAGQVDLIVTNKASESRHRRALPVEKTFDPLTALVHLRAWQPHNNTPVLFYVMSGTQLWHNESRYAGKTTVRTVLGKRKARRVTWTARRMTPDLKIDKSRRPRRFTAWFSDDKESIPLRILIQTEYGNLDLTLTSYERPREAKRSAVTVL